MRPELVDETILAYCAPHFRKVAMIVWQVVKALEVPKGANIAFVGDRIKALVEDEKLESAGDLDHWTYSEVRLPQKKTAGAAAETSRVRATTEQGT